MSIVQPPALVVDESSFGRYVLYVRDAGDGGGVGAPIIFGVECWLDVALFSEFKNVSTLIPSSSALKSLDAERGHDVCYNRVVCPSQVIVGG